MLTDRQLQILNYLDPKRFICISGINNHSHKDTVDAKVLVKLGLADIIERTDKQGFDLFLPTYEGLKYRRKHSD